MRQIRYIEIQPRPRNIFAQLLGLVAGVAVLILSVVLGAFLLAAFFGFVLIVAVTVYARFWWLRRQAMRQRDSEFIDVEYRVLDETRRGGPRQ